MMDADRTVIAKPAWIQIITRIRKTVFQGELMEKYPEIAERLKWFLEARPELCTLMHDPRKPGVAGRRLGSILDETKLRRVLAALEPQQAVELLLDKIKKTRNNVEFLMQIQKTTLGPGNE